MNRKNIKGNKRQWDNKRTNVPIKIIKEESNNENII